MTKDELRVYLAKIMKLETERYEISLAVSQLKKERNLYRQMADKPACEERREIVHYCRIGRDNGGICRRIIYGVSAMDSCF